MADHLDFSVSVPRVDNDSKLHPAPRPFVGMGIGFSTSGLSSADRIVSHVYRAVSNTDSIRKLYNNNFYTKLSRKEFDVSAESDFSSNV